MGTEPTTTTENKPFKDTWLGQNWHWGAGAVGGATAGALLLGQTLGRLGGEDSGWRRAMNWIGGIAGLIGGVFLAGEAKGDDRLKDTVSSKSPEAGKVLEGVSKKIDELKETDFQKSFDDVVKELGELSEEAKKTLKDPLDPLDDKDDDVVNLSDIPAARYEAAKKALKEAYAGK
jgi:hypothetical protein